MTMIPYDSPKLDAVLDALANQKRRGMVHELALCPATVGQLARQHDLSLPAVHKHIRILEQAGLIMRRKVGRTNFVVLDHCMLELVQQWIGQYHTQWGSAEASLENYISRMRQ